MEISKEQLRKDMLGRRKSITEQKAVLNSERIMHKIMCMNKFASSNIIMCYIDFKNEVSTKAFIRSCLTLGKSIAVPVVLPSGNGCREMIASKVSEIDTELEKGCFGILEPKRHLIRKVKPEDIDMVIVPGVAFDEKLNRVGYGAGFYDRFLKNTRDDCLKIGIAYEIQVLRDVPAESFDIPMDIVVTENRIIEGKV